MEHVKLRATRTTGQHKAGQTIVVNSAIAKALVLLKVAEYLTEDVKANDDRTGARKKRTYKRRDLQAE